jgi:hypothetical protein
MAFQTSYYEDSNFRNLGWSTGGATSSSTSGKTKEQLLEIACSCPAPNEKLSRIGTRIHLKELHKRYQEPNWHRHYTGTERYNLAATSKRIEEGTGTTNEAIQSIPPGD